MNALNKKLISAANLIIITAIVLTNISMAQIVQPQPITSISRVSDIYNIATNVLGWFYAFFFVIAAIFIIIAAFNYLTAQGDPEKVGKAKSMIIYAVIAIVVALLAVTFKVFVENFLINRGGA